LRGCFVNAPAELTHPLADFPVDRVDVPGQSCVKHRFQKIALRNDSLLPAAKKLVLQSS